MKRPEEVAWRVFCLVLGAAVVMLVLQIVGGLLCQLR